MSLYASTSTMFTRYWVDGNNCIRIFLDNIFSLTNSCRNAASLWEAIPYLGYLEEDISDV